MPRLLPVGENEVSGDVLAAFQKHVNDYKGRITNMKATLGHSLIAFEVYMQWYPLYEEVKAILGRRLAYLFAYAISESSNCPLCSTYFRKIIIENGENPNALQLSRHEKDVLNFGEAIAKNHGYLADGIYNAVAKKYEPAQMVVLIAFAGQMIATNIFNNVVETSIDDYLAEYLPPVKNVLSK
jgi:hypothetical protein